MAELDHLGTIEGSIQDGGWRANGDIFGDADRLAWYQAVESWLWLYAGGAWEASPRLAFRGHLLPDAWQKTFQTSVAPWQGFTAQEFMRRAEVQGIFFRDESTPANAHQVNGLTYGHIIEHTCGIVGEYGHCNLVRDVWPEGFMDLNIDKTNSVAIDEHEVKRGNFWSRLQEIANIQFFLLYLDKTNTLNAIFHPMFGTLPTPVLDIDSDLLLEPLKITPRNTEQVGQIRLQGSTPAGLQISGKYPADATAGPIIQRTGFKATASTLMNTISERMYKYDNRDVSVVATLPGAIGLLLELMDRVSITYTSSVDGVAWSAKKFWIEAIRVEIQRDFMATTTLNLEAENA